MVGAVLGIGLLRGGKSIQWRILLNIGAGWVTTPIIAALVCFVSLFFLQNVFNQKVYSEVGYSLSRTVMARLDDEGIDVGRLADIKDEEFTSAIRFRDALRRRLVMTKEEEAKALADAEVFRTVFTPLKLAALDPDGMTHAQVAAVKALEGRSFRHRWQLVEALAAQNPEWRLLEENKVNKLRNKRVRLLLTYIERTFAVGD